MSYNQTNSFDLLLQGLGSGTIAMTIPVWQASATAALVDNNIRVTPIYIPKDDVVTSVVFFQRTQGVYTADTYNGIGLYSFSGGVLTLVASTTNDGNIWKGVANTYVTTAFSSPYNIAKGVYYLGFLYNTSNQTTAPAILGVTMSSAAQATIDMPTGVVLAGTVTAANSLTTPITASTSITTIQTEYWALLK